MAWTSLHRPMTLRPNGPRRPRACRVLALLAVSTLVPARPPLLAKADPGWEGRRAFDIPAGDAGDTLREFVRQAEAQVVFPSDAVRGVTTRAVRGEWTPLEALERMIEGTVLSVIQDRLTGALSLARTDRRRTGRTRPALPPRERPSEAGVGGLETVRLNPFEVEADSDRSYGILNANSITAFKAALDRLPVTADIFDQAFLDDVAAVDVEAAVQAYDAGSQFGALNASNAAQNQPGDHVANGSLRLRGSPIGDMQINGLLIAGSIGNPGGTSFGSTSSYYLERIEVIDGPQAILFAGGGPGGVINLETKEARIGQPNGGSVSLRIDPYGSKLATVDYRESEGKTAVRVALADGTEDSRRVNIGERLKGGYLQIATELADTVVRLSLQQSVSTRVTQDDLALSSGGAGDPYAGLNGDHLEYLLASGRAAPIAGGHLDWGDTESFAGDWSGDNEVAEWASLSAETKWTGWLSTELSVAAGNFDDDQPGGGTTINLYTPACPSNPIPGNWTLAMPTSGSPVSDEWRPRRNKAVRFSAVLTDDLFGGRAHSQTDLIGDYTGNRNAIIPYGYYLADSDFNVVLSGQGARTPIPAQAWTVNDGPVLYPLFNPGAARILYGGARYVREPQQPGGAGQSNGDFNAGFAVLNYMEWMDDRLDTLVGFRLSHQKAWSGVSAPSEVRDAPNFSLGADFHATSWLAPYFLASSVWATAAAQNAQIDGTLPPVAHAIGAEAGLKIDASGGRIAGSVSVYGNLANDEQYNGGGNLASYVSPNGLNGEVPNGTGAYFASDVETRGFTAAMTAAPTREWRLRLSAAITRGRFGTGVAIPELYNDQFHENAAGEVTYADGTVVYVPSIFSPSHLTVPSTASNAVPLTVAMLSTPGSQYYASPQPVDGAILKTSSGGQVLLSPPDPVHGSILTGATGLPISNYQLDTALSGVVPLGSLDAVRAGDQTWGYPEYSVTVTGVHEWTAGPIKGFKLGGTLALNWRDLAFNYYPNGFTGANFSNETPFRLPMVPELDLIAGYRRRLGRVTWSTQINVFNLLNHYKVVVYPGVATGWTTPSGLTANLDQQPRNFAWTNTISF
jgi:outer membrane receptor protein involved in Fe transport